MKKQVLLLIMMVLPMVACAYDAYIDGIYYNFNSGEKTAYVTSNIKVFLNNYSGDIIIPNEVTYNGEKYSVTSIGGYAFSGCSGLTSVTIPNSVTSIGSSAFMNCSGLTSLTIGNSVTSIGWSAFEGCSGLTSVTIGNSVTSIGNNAFNGCSGLTSVTIPNSVTSIGGGAFAGCSGLEEVHITDIAAWCNINFHSNQFSYAHHLFMDGKEITDLVIPNSVTSIGGSAFEGCSSLTSVTIPNSVTSIGEYAFSSCHGLTSVTIGNSVTSIGEYAFSGCSGLTSVTIPNSVTSIGGYAFHNCSGLTSITIPNSVRSIGSYAFNGCSGLTSIVVDKNNPVYDSRDNCNAIIETATNTLICGCKKTIIPNSVTSIGERAFSGCSGLTSVAIPESVKNIGSEAFSNCMLREIYVGGVVPDMGSSSFSPAIYNHAILYVPNGTWETYAYNGGWYQFIRIKEITTSIEDLAPQHTYNLMNMDDSSYAVYDQIDNGVKSLAAMNDIDEDNPNHSWQMTEKDGNTYLYNIGAKKFAKSSANGVGFTLSDTPCPITMENGEDGIVLGSQRKTQWSFVVNEGQSANLDLNNIITSIETTRIESQMNETDWYTLDGIKLNGKPIEKGVYIVNGKKVYVK